MKAARELGVVFTTRTPDYVVINVVCWRERERERGKERILFVHVVWCGREV